MSMMLVPLFVGGNFNREKKRMRVEFVKDVSNETDRFQLYRKSGKPDREHPSSEQDKYYLHIMVKDWLIPLNITESYLVSTVGKHKAFSQLCEGHQDFFQWINSFSDPLEQQEAISEANRLVELYGSDVNEQFAYINAWLQMHVDQFLDSKGDPAHKFPDFIGAAVLEQTEECCRMSDIRKKYLEEQDAAVQKKREEEDARERDAKDAAIQAEKEKYLGWADQLTAMQFGKAKACLERLIRYDGRVISKREFVLSMVKNGYVPYIEEGVYHYRNRWDCEPTKAKTEYRLSKNNLCVQISKTEYDFAKYIAEHPEVIH